ncbi:MAG: hypothetical protein FK733_09835 [Asgard group archaeon]|nr:hypothetical protein [Asgard group archaeon]
MEINMLVELMNNLEQNLNDSPPIYNSFKTKVGKKFENNFKELMEFTNLGNALSNIPYLYTISSDFFDKFKIIEYLPFVIKLFSDEPLSDIEQNELKEKIIHDITIIIESIEVKPETNENVSKYMERINSYFFLAYFAYLDVYIKSIIEYLESILNPELFELLNEKIKSKRERNDLINIIKKTLSLITPEEFGLVLKKRSWKRSFDTLLDRRHFMAHNDPKARFGMLEAKFKEVTDKAKKQTNKLQKELASQFNKKNLVKKILDGLKFNLLVYFTLLEIGKDCYSYLALIDVLIEDYVVNIKK